MLTPADWAATTRRAQGLPEYLEDPALLAELAADVVEALEAEVGDASQAA
jgi:hypothetical protein